METTDVRVREISEAEARSLVDAKTVEKLGEGRVGTMTVSFVAELLPGNRKFVIDWKGSDESRALQGVAVGEHEIGSLESTLVRSSDGAAIGSFEQMFRYAGKSGAQQRVLITLF
jgi:hypothetical protein